MKKTFEEYLKERHAEHYMGTDDDMPENFEHWLEGLQINGIIEMADTFIQSVREGAIRECSEIVNSFYDYRVLGSTDTEIFKKIIINQACEDIAQEITNLIPEGK